jgi:hypothetical protein
MLRLQEEMVKNWMRLVASEMSILEQKLQVEAALRAEMQQRLYTLEKLVEDQRRMLLAVLGGGLLEQQENAADGGGGAGAGAPTIDVVLQRSSLAESYGGGQARGEKAHDDHDLQTLRRTSRGWRQELAGLGHAIRPPH